MTEAQLRSFPAFETLPIYDERDQGADQITIAIAGGYNSIKECSTIREVEECLSNPRLVPLGGVRAGPDGQVVVIAFFGERR